LVRVDSPARSPRAEEPASDDRDPGALMALLKLDDRSPEPGTSTSDDRVDAARG
jgi:hypothetical protein